MGRIEKAFEMLFTDSLQTINARKIDKGIEFLKRKAQEICFEKEITETDALLECHRNLRDSVARFLEITGRAGERKNQQKWLGENPLFLCDAGLGGLARWLWATGQRAMWYPNIDDNELIKIALEYSAILLTTDTLIFGRRVLRDKIIPSLWLPPTLKPVKQLEIVFENFNLKVKEPLCMKCGASLEDVEKEKIIDRIPPRTLRWIDHYYICSACGSIFWRGTHWKRINPVVDKLKVKFG